MSTAPDPALLLAHSSHWSKTTLIGENNDAKEGMLFVHLLLAQLSKSIWFWLLALNFCWSIWRPYVSIFMFFQKYYHSVVWWAPTIVEASRKEDLRSAWIMSLICLLSSLFTDARPLITQVNMSSTVRMVLERKIDRLSWWSRHRTFVK